MKVRSWGSPVQLSNFCGKDLTLLFGRVFIVLCIVPHCTFSMTYDIRDSANSTITFRGDSRLGPNELEVSPPSLPLARKRTTMGANYESHSSSDLMSVFKMSLLQEHSKRKEEHRIRKTEREKEKERRLYEKNESEKERKDELKKQEDSRY